MENQKAKFVIHVAVSDNGVIGKEGKLPWKLPSDMARFRAHTLGRPLIMGRKTFESLGAPFDRRMNVVVSGSMAQNKQLQAENSVFVVGSTMQARRSTQIAAADMNSDEICVIGGAQIYEEFLRHNLISRIYMTRVHVVLDGDTKFPAINPDQWEETVVKSKIRVHVDDDFVTSYIVYNRVYP